MEFLCKFDPFLADHVARFGYKGKGEPSYLSFTMVDEFVLLLSDSVKTKITYVFDSDNNGKIFIIIVDSTSISNVNQLTFVIRFVATD